MYINPETYFIVSERELTTATVTLTDHAFPSDADISIEFFVQCYLYLISLATDSPFELNKMRNLSVELAERITWDVCTWDVHLVCIASHIHIIEPWFETILATCSVRCDADARPHDFDQRDLDLHLARHASNVDENRRFHWFAPTSAASACVCVCVCADRRCKTKRNMFYLLHIFQTNESECVCVREFFCLSLIFNT